MHGAVEYENGINKVFDQEMAGDEREMMKMADLILAVSSQFEMWLKKELPGVFIKDIACYQRSGLGAFKRKRH